MASYAKNIKRNARRPSVSQTPYLTAKSGSGRKSEEEAIEMMRKLDSWSSLGQKK